ncbi:uncharacterized protein LOC127786928 [Diospyros lotus]|uniref:uncharacterized protein LOC127786928 n=1 Tax=Diospyros lotus TaxID=55363 RepID=UPI00224E088C|nr:uncharacterized protein LOC127786928 [Diospyros lotus]
MEIAEQRKEKDVQEVEKTELQQQQWRQEEEEMEEEETAVALQERRSRQPSATTIVVNSTGGVNVLFPLSEEHHNGFQKHGQEALQDGDKDGNGLEEDSEAISGKNVYYDKDQGTESVDGFSVTENNRLLFSASERSSKDDGLVAAMENFDDQKSQSHAINNQTKEISNDRNFSHKGYSSQKKTQHLDS